MAYWAPQVDSQFEMDAACTAASEDEWMVLAVANVMKTKLRPELAGEIARRHEETGHPVLTR
jgi:hypothetical protein